MLYVPGSDFMDTKDVPHGAVASVYYYSSVLKTTRRMHVYTPPGYETGSQKYPVFYLLHGAGDTDDAWTSVGRAGFIFDNLIATKKVKPMILVMPAGHQPGVPGFGAPPAAGPGVTNRPTAVNPFTDEFVTDIMPYAEKNYRIIPDRQHRAIAGLSMGGSQTLDIAFTHLEKFAYLASTAPVPPWGAAADAVQRLQSRRQPRLRSSRVRIGRPPTKPISTMSD
jgi:enterochelin esterase family protein